MAFSAPRVIACECRPGEGEQLVSNSVHGISSSRALVGRVGSDIGSSVGTVASCAAEGTVAVVSCASPGVAKINVAADTPNKSALRRNAAGRVLTSYFSSPGRHSHAITRGAENAVGSSASS